MNTFDTIRLALMKHAQDDLRDDKAARRSDPDYQEYMENQITQLNDCDSLESLSLIDWVCDQAGMAE